MTRDTNAKVALVTGAGQGTGQSIAERLHADGFRVALADIDHAKTDQLVAELGGIEEGVISVPVDVADRESVFDAVRLATNELGGFDVIVNNAGIAPLTPIEEITAESIGRIFAINFNGVVWGTQAAAAAFRELGHGGKTIAAASQATQSAARDLAKFGITANTYAPGIVRTPLMAEVAKNTAEAAGTPEEWGWAQFTAGIALERLAEARDVANLVSFLAGKDSDYITGQSILVDGGMVFN